MAERLKTADVDATNHSKLSFRGLVDILEPDGPAISTNWKSIVDRDEQVIVFFQVEYMQFIPQLSKCIRIRRDRTKQFEEILVPSVFFGRHLDDSFVEKTFGRSHLAHLSELYRLLDIVNQSEKKTNLSNDSDGEQKNDYGDSITAPTVDGDEQEMITIPQFLPSYPSNVYPRSNQLSSTTDFVITEVLPSAQISAHEDEDRESISSASEEYHRSSELSDREVRSIKKKRKTSDMEDNRVRVYICDLYSRKSSAHFDPLQRISTVEITFSSLLRHGVYLRQWSQSARTFPLIKLIQPSSFFAHKKLLLFYIVGQNVAQEQGYSPDGSAVCTGY